MNDIHIPRRLLDARVIRAKDAEEKLKKDKVVILHYNFYNKGEMIWKHDRVQLDDDGDVRAFGSFMNTETGEWFPVDGYLYEHNGLLCCGSGAEPVCFEMPDDIPNDEWDEYEAHDGYDFWV